MSSMVASSRSASGRSVWASMCSLTFLGLAQSCASGATPAPARADVVSSDTLYDVAHDTARDASNDATRDVSLDAHVPGADAATELGADVATDLVITVADSDLARPDDVPDFEPGVATLAGTGEPGFVDGLRIEARFDNPVNVAVSPEGAVFIADFGNDAVRRIEPDGWVTTFLHARGFEAPFGMAFAPDGTFFVETDTNDRGMRNDTTGTLWRLLPGERTLSVVVRDVGRPRGLVVLDDGRIAMSDYVAHVISVLDLRDRSVTVLAGARGMAGFVDGVGAAARFNRPYGIARRVDGSLLVADQSNQRIRVIELDGTVTTLAGSGARGAADGMGVAATFDGPQGVAIDGDGTLYVSESGGHTVRRVDAKGSVTTVAGDGREGYIDGALREAEFFGLEGLALSPDGATAYLPDGNRGGSMPHHRVRRMTLR
jgi:DNA-binding beta-propeller fold protein YncE